MKYVALLRGVNVGGRGRIDMKQLKAAFEAAGMDDVRTYINSGNVIFTSDVRDRPLLVDSLERAIEADFGFAVSVLILDAARLRSIVAALPGDWTNDDTAKCDVFFLWHDADDPSVLEQLESDPAIEDVRYTPGAVIRRVARANAAKSKLTRIVGTPLYQRMTIRNCNTARKLAELIEG